MCEIIHLHVEADRVVLRLHVHSDCATAAAAPATVRSEVEVDGEPIQAWVWNGISSIEADGGAEGKQKDEGIYPKLL